MRLLNYVVIFFVLAILLFTNRVYGSDDILNQISMSQISDGIHINYKFTVEKHALPNAIVEAKEEAIKHTYNNEQHAKGENNNTTSVKKQLLEETKSILNDSNIVSGKAEYWGTSSGSIYINHSNKRCYIFNGDTLYTGSSDDIGPDRLLSKNTKENKVNVVVSIYPIINKQTYHYLEYIDSSTPYLGFIQPAKPLFCIKYNKHEKKTTNNKILDIYKYNIPNYPVFEIDVISDIHGRVMEIDQKMSHGMQVDSYIFNDYKKLSDNFVYPCEIKITRYLNYMHNNKIKTNIDTVENFMILTIQEVHLSNDMLTVDKLPNNTRVQDMRYSTNKYVSGSNYSYQTGKTVDNESDFWHKQQVKENEKANNINGIKWIRVILIGILLLLIGITIKKYTHQLEGIDKRKH